MSSLTVKELLELKGVRQIAFVQIAREEEAIAASQAGMDMIGTAFRKDTSHIAALVPETHFQYGLPWGKHAVQKPHCWMQWQPWKLAHNQCIAG